MGMFSKVIAFLDKAAGVPLWITHADNIRKLDVERGCPLLAKAIVENEILWPLSSYSLEEMLPQIAGMITVGKVVAGNNINSTGLKQLAHEVIAAVEGPVEGPLQVLYDFVGKDIPDIEIVEVDAPSSLAKFAEEVFADSEVTATVEATSTEEVTATVEATSTEEVTTTSAATSTEEVTATVEATSTEEVTTTSAATSTEEVTATVEATSTEEVTATVEATSTEEVHIPVLDPQVRAQLIHGMTKVISRGRKVGPTLKVLNTMSGGDRAAILEALHIMEARGNSLAKAILEDTSL